MSSSHWRTATPSGPLNVSSVARSARPLLLLAKSPFCSASHCSKNQPLLGNVKQYSGAPSIAMTFSQAASTSAHVVGTASTPAASSMVMFENQTAEDVFKGIDV